MNDEVVVPVRVLDASVLLGVLFQEVALEVVPLEGSAVSAVNWSEVLQVAVRRGADVAGLGDAIGAEGVVIVPFSAEHAASAAALSPHTRVAGLSLADRACLALAESLSVPALTADRAWRDVAVGVEVVLVR